MYKLGTKKYHHFSKEEFEKPEELTIEIDCGTKIDGENKLDNSVEEKIEF